MTMTDTEKEVHTAFNDYMNSYFNRRDFHEVARLFHDRITCFGTGTDEKAFDLAATKNLYLRDINQAKNPITVIFHEKQVIELEKNTGLALAEIDIEGSIDKQPFYMKGLRLSLVFTKSENTWRLIHKHISLPTIEQESGEAFPLKEIQDRNRLLEKMVAEKTAELTKANNELKKALSEIKELSGLLPICSNCKKIRDDTGSWSQIEEYISHHTDTQFSHGICPDCVKILYPDIAAEIITGTGILKEKGKKDA